MAEAPNILFLLSLTSVIYSVTSYLIFCEVWAMLTFLCWVRNKWHAIAQQAAKTDKSSRKIRRQRTSIANHIRYHCFKQRMKHKRIHKGHYIKPKPLFHLTWKFKAIQLTIRVAAFIYLVGCCVERLVGHSFHLLLHLRQLWHPIELNC